MKKKIDWNNPEEVSQQRKRRYRKHREEELDYQKKYYREHPEEYRQFRMKYYEENRESLLKRAKSYRRKNAKARIEYSKNYHRNHRLRVNGKDIYVSNKRHYTGYCELCGKENVRLSYHHWDDKDPSKGIWVCLIPCHQICEQVDKHQLYLAQRYIKFKNLLNKMQRNNAIGYPNLNANK